MTGEREDIRIPGPRREAVLLLHGLTGVPNELHALGDAIARDGYPVHIPLLPGRGTVAADMDRLTWEDWMDAAVRAYDELAGDHEAVVVGGLSAGGTMALDLALRRPVRALLLYAAAVSVSRRAAYLAPYGWRVIRRWGSPGRRHASTEPAREVSTYDPIPVRAVAELVRGMRRVRPRLGEITAPALVLHAAGDPWVPASSGREIAARLAGPVALEILPGDGHAITAGPDRDVVAARTRAYLDRTIGPALS
ncbi:MAG: alpha/beta fold hydrolase [Candidatus Limnocylindrales bacterium]